ncbi:unnamed protein product [Protopolystoma xenopodis]|uniref:Uncharacterized protein n=1 Tax=Protopolystoma xenopodis TaxID=117903 RepID=A0A3S5ACV0_9PLAT|nr:unnamed protein product [Protopolystoma xenopodis]
MFILSLFVILFKLNPLPGHDANLVDSSCHELSTPSQPNNHGAESDPVSTSLQSTCSLPFSHPEMETISTPLGQAAGHQNSWLAEANQLNSYASIVSNDDFVIESERFVAAEDFERDDQEMDLEVDGGDNEDDLDEDDEVYDVSLLHFLLSIILSHRIMSIFLPSVTNSKTEESSEKSNPV